MFEKPPPEVMWWWDKGLMKFAATSGSSTVNPGFIWVAPTDVMNGHVA